jgi:hypothetical protein
MAYQANLEPVESGPAHCPDWYNALQDGAVLLAEAIDVTSSISPTYELTTLLHAHRNGQIQLDGRSAKIVDLADKSVTGESTSFGEYASRLGQIARCNAFLESLK